MAEGDQAPMIPRVGLRMQLQETFTDLTYYGRGSKENYRDRRTSQFIGEYTIPLKDMYEPYVRPQENNHRTDIYWCALTDKTQRGLLLIADRTFELNASNYPWKVWTAATRLTTALRVPKRPITTTSPTLCRKRWSICSLTTA